MFPANMPLPMTLALTNESIGRKKLCKKKLVIIRKKYHHDPGGHIRCKDSITINKHKVV